LGENKGKFLVQPANDLEGRNRCLDVGLTWSRRNETKLSGPDGISDKIVIAAGGVNDASVQPFRSRARKARSSWNRSAIRSTTGSGLLRRAVQFEIVPWRSVSNMKTRSPSSMAATARPTHKVDFPVPPFWQAKVIARITFSPLRLLLHQANKDYGESPAV
jgi:hypothetical protein